MKCDHLDYDDYFEKCLDCGLIGEAIHADECIAAGFQIDEEGHCERCGIIVEEK